MKKLFICCKENVKKHFGEEYDEILLVNKDVSTENLDHYFPRIKDAVRLTNSYIKEEETDKSVEITLDAPVPFFWICQQLQIEMKDKEDIIVKLPQVPEVKDVEPVY